MTYLEDLSAMKSKEETTFVLAYLVCPLPVKAPFIGWISDWLFVSPLIEGQPTTCTWYNHLLYKRCPKKTIYGQKNNFNGKLRNPNFDEKKGEEEDDEEDREEKEENDVEENEVEE